MAERILDPLTGRPAFYGPHGEGGSASPAEFLRRGIPRSAVETHQMTDGTTVYYVPWSFITAAGRQVASEQRQATQTPTTAEPETFNAATAASIKTVLTSLDLDELVPLVDQWVRNGVSSFAEVEMQLMDRNSDAGRVVQRKYGVFFDLMDQGRYQSIGEIRAYRVNTRALLAQRGLLAAFPDVDAAADTWLRGNKSLPEQAARLDAIEEDVRLTLSTDPEARQEMEAWTRFYGAAPTLQDLVAVALNADSLPEIERRARAVALERAAGRGGFGDLSRQEAEQIADLGADPLAAQETFGTLANLQPLGSPLLGTREDAISRDEFLDAGFTGNAQARRRIERRQRERSASFSAGGGFASGSEGFAVGSAT